MKHEQIRVQIPASVAECLDLMAYERGASKKDVISEILRGYFAQLHREDICGQCGRRKI